MVEASSEENNLFSQKGTHIYGVINVVLRIMIAHNVIRDVSISNKNKNHIPH